MADTQAFTLLGWKGGLNGVEYEALQKAVISLTHAPERLVADSSTAFWIDASYSTP